MRLWPLSKVLLVVIYLPNPSQFIQLIKRKRSKNPCILIKEESHFTILMFNFKAIESCLILIYKLEVPSNQTEKVLTWNLVTSFLLQSPQRELYFSYKLILNKRLTLSSTCLIWHKRDVWIFSTMMALRLKRRRSWSLIKSQTKLNV